MKRSVPPGGKASRGRRIQGAAAPHTGRAQAWRAKKRNSDEAKQRNSREPRSQARLGTALAYNSGRNATFWLSTIRARRPPYRDRWDAIARLARKQWRPNVPAAQPPLGALAQSARNRAQQAAAVHAGAGGPTPPPRGRRAAGTLFAIANRSNHWSACKTKTRQVNYETT